MPDPNQGKCIRCSYYIDKGSGDPRYACKYPRLDSWDWVLDKEWEDEVDCYKVNLDGTCPFWETTV